MSHEIRTPLNVVLGALELTLQTRVSAEQLEYLELMKTAGETLLGLVNDILDYSRIEAGGMKIEQVPFSLSRCIEETLRMLGGEARRKGLRLRCELAPGMPDGVRGDPLRLRQVLLNLLANAIKFSENGEVVLRAGPEASAGPDLVCRFRVTDCGIGIPPERQADIFAPWQQAESATCRKYGGSGLGLSIAARLVGLMGGEIGVVSRPGAGSTFHFNVRFGRIPAVRNGHRPHPARHRLVPRFGNRTLDILLVEDNAMNSRLAHLALEKAGHRVAHAGSGREACERLAASRPDLVLLDLQLPDMDGAEVVAEIRRQEDALGCDRLPVIALTADTRPGMRARCLQAGMDDYLAKPLDPAALWRVFGQATAQPEAILDRQTLLGRTHSDRRLLGEIRDLFVRDSGPLLARIRTALDRDDRQELDTSLHTLSGMFRSLAASTAESTAERLAGHAARSDRAAAEAALAQLGIDVTRVAETLRHLAGEPTSGSARIALPAIAKRLARHPGKPPSRKGHHRLSAAKARIIIAKGANP